MMKHANINAVRVHAHLEGEAFYAQCDEKGILVWQDFALQWGYDDDPDFVKEASRQALAMVNWLFNHPRSPPGPCKTSRPSTPIG